MPFQRNQWVRRMRVAVKIAFGVLMLLAIAPANARAAVYYVAPSGGSDSKPGSVGSPFATFTKAIAAAAAGDTIYARGGTYSLSTTVSIGSSKSGNAANPIKLFAFPG